LSDCYYYRLDDGIGDEIGDHNHDNFVRHHSIGDWAGRNHFLGDWQIVGYVGVVVDSVDVDANVCSSAAMGVAVQNGSVDDSLDGAFAGCGDDYCCHRC